MLNMQRYDKRFFERQQRESIQSAMEIVPLILKLIQPKKIIDVGCGVGTWLSVFKEYGVDEVLGVDGDYVDRKMLLIPKERFVPLDLRKAIPISEQFDLALSLEVAEHLPPDSAKMFIESLTKLAPVILFSASVPFQAKTRGVHLNEQWLDYWVEKFRSKGFVMVDCIRKQIWQNENVAWWYAQNMMVFVKQDSLVTYPLLKNEYAETKISYISVIHPKLYLLWSDFENLPLRRLFLLLKKLLLAISISIRRKVAKRLLHK